jgi:hypothetical protein
VGKRVDDAREGVSVGVKVTKRVGGKDGSAANGAPDGVEVDVGSEEGPADGK